MFRVRATKMEVSTVRMGILHDRRGVSKAGSKAAKLPHRNRS
jgi:hypothetical protein